MVQLLLADPKPTVSMDVVLEEAPASLPPVIAELVAIQICSAKSVEETCVYGKPNSGEFRVMLGNCDSIQLNEKYTMQNLNDRLASYLEEVRSLEAANANLERQIREYCEKKGPICQKDYSAYWNTINCLKEEVLLVLF